MEQRKALDAQASLIMFVLCLLWGLQQVVLKLAAPDISALMQIALRSALSALMVYLLIQAGVRRQLWSRSYLPAGLLVGVLFALEFYLVAEALRYTSASHTIVLLYTAPIFVALGLHWKLPSEHLSPLQWGGILVAFSGIVVSFLFRSHTGQAMQASMLWGDLLALMAGIFWAATTVSVRLTRLAEAPATQTLFYQLLMGGMVLLPLAWMTGQATVNWTTLSISSLIFHTVVISFASYLSWNIVLLGVEISYAITAFESGQDCKIHPILMLLDLLELFYRKQKTGESISEAQALEVLGRDEIGRLPSYISMFEKQNLIKRTEDNEYVLVRDLDQVNFWDFYLKLPYALPHTHQIENLQINDLWMQRLQPKLREADHYLAENLGIPLSELFKQKEMQNETQTPPKP